MIKKLWIIATAFNRCPAIHEDCVWDEIRRYNMEVK